MAASHINSHHLVGPDCGATRIVYSSNLSYWALQPLYPHRAVVKHPNWESCDVLSEFLFDRYGTTWTYDHEQTVSWKHRSQRVRSRVEGGGQDPKKTGPILAQVIIEQSYGMMLQFQHFAQTNRPRKPREGPLWAHRGGIVDKPMGISLQ